MKRKVIPLLGTVFLGTIVFWALYFTVFEIWINWQHSDARKARSDTSNIVYYNRYDDVRLGIEKTDFGWINKKLDIIDPETGEATLLTEIVKRSSDKAGNVYLQNVKEFGQLRHGEIISHGVVLAPDEIPENTWFYVSYNRMGFGMCNNESCAPLEGRIIQCMGGWLAGDDQNETSHAMGLDNRLVKRGRSSMVIISDKNNKIIGIFPYHTEADILRILGTFPQFEESLNDCIDEELGLPYAHELRPLERPKQVPQLSGAELQVWTKKAKKTAILMPDGSMQDSKGQILYEPSFDPSEERYHIYRAGYGYYVEQEVGSEKYLSFKQKTDAIEWIKNEMKGRGYTVVDF